MEVATQRVEATARNSVNSKQNGCSSASPHAGCQLLGNPESLLSGRFRKPRWEKYFRASVSRRAVFPCSPEATRDGNPYPVEVVNAR
jgi:hypothetical protein